MPGDNSEIKNAGNLISSILSPSVEESEQQSNQPLEDEEQDQESQLGTTEDESETEAEEETSGQEEDDTETEAEEQEELYTVKVNGEEFEVTLEELRKGYMKDKDYHIKTTNLNKEKEQVHSKLTEVSTIIEDAEFALRFEEEDLNSEDNLQLKEYDPSEYYAKKEALEAKRQKLNTLKQKHKQEVIQREQELLKNALPEWLDDNVAKADIAKIQNLWKSLNFSAQDVDKFVDHRLALMALKAAKYDEISQAKPRAKAKRVQQKPKSAKPGSPSSKNSTQQHLAKRSKLKQSGNLKDAANLLKDFF